MKKIVFSVLALAAIMVSCNSNEDFAGVSSVSGSTAATVASYVAQNYPDTKIVSTTGNGSTVTATLNTGETLSFAKDGSVLSYANNSNLGIAADSLCAPKDSLGRPPHDGSGSEGRGRGGRGHGGTGRPGEGPRPDSTHVGGGVPGHGHDLHFQNEISVDSLASTINTYIAANYSGYKVIHAELDTICQGAVTEVMVCTSTKEPVKLVFDATGAFLMKGQRFAYADVPAEVSAAVTANYSTYDVKNRAEKFTMANASVQYKVFLELNKVRHSVTFNADGTVACEK